MFHFNKYALAISLGAPLLGSTMAWADTSNLTEANYRDLSARIQLLEQELQQLRLESSIAPKQEAPAIAQSTLPSTLPDTNKGLSIASQDGQYSVNLHALVQFDSRSFVHNETPNVTDTFTIRRAEPSLEGNLTSLFSYRLMPEFGGSPTSTVTADMYGEFHFSPQYANVRVGKFKTPFGLENLQNSGNTAFVERGFPTSLSPNRDEGIQLAGTLPKNNVSYALGIFNGAPDGSDSAPSDADKHKDIASRVFLQPWLNTTSVLSGLGFGVAGTAGNQNGSVAGINGVLPQYKTPGQNIFFQYNTGVVANGLRTRWSPQANYYKGPFSLMAEYVESSQTVSLGSRTSSIKNSAQELTVGYILTGEKAGYNGIKVNSPFAKSNGWGAFELVSRIGELRIDNQAFTNGFASLKTNAALAQSVGAGLNWYLTNNIKLAFDYEQTRFQGGAINGKNRPDEQAILMRSQYTF